MRAATRPWRPWLRLAAGPLVALLAPGRPAASAEAEHAPIPVRFTLPAPACVTVAIEDASGRRVRNLVSAEPFPAGTNTVWWDGLDDLDRDTAAADHGVYHVPGKFVVPGTYRARGLACPPLSLRYALSVYNPGNPPWPTADKGSSWIADHSPPSAVLYLPDDGTPTNRPCVLVASHRAESGPGLVWLDTEGRKIRSQQWLGGVWTAANQLTRDAGANADPAVYAYAGAPWKGDKFNKFQVELRLHKLLRPGFRGEGPRDKRFGSGEDRALLGGPWKFPDGTKLPEDDDQAGLSGLAARNGILVASLPVLQALLVIDARADREIGRIPLEDPRGVAFDNRGRLLVLSGKRLLRFTPRLEALAVDAPDVLVAGGLDDPRQLTIDAAGRVYVSDWGRSHQVKVFEADGAFLRAIGQAGVPGTGPYNPAQMRRPYGLAVLPDGRLWVAENDDQPRRLSLWSAAGRLLDAWYGPPGYGGGGALDPRDPGRFYHNGMEFELDWERGASRLASVFYRPAAGDLRPEGHHMAGGPQAALYVNDRRYFVNCFNSDPVKGTPIGFIWRDRGGVVVPAAVVGRANAWERFKDAAYAGRLPGNVNWNKDEILFAWSDRNGDARMQPEEVTFARAWVLSMVVQSGLDVVMGGGRRLKPNGFTEEGVPLYDAAQVETLLEGAQKPVSTGGGQALLSPEGWFVLTTAPRPFAPQGIGGGRAGQALWSYPSLWPGLHASHIAPLPERSGELTGTTRLLGGFFTPRGSDAGPLWAINGNKGNVYVFTADGLFVATLFQDCRRARWAYPRAERGMSVNDASLGEEAFGVTLTQAGDGRIYIVGGVGPACNIARVEGLEGLRRLPGTDVSVTPELLREAQRHLQRREAQRQQGAADRPLIIAHRPQSPVVDGKLDDWANAGWVTLEERTHEVGYWQYRKVRTEAALAVAGDRLFAAFRTGDTNLLCNAGEPRQLLFKTGGALDLMLGTNPGADPAREAAASGDVRLLVAKDDGRTVAMLYRPVAPGAPGPRVPFSSPVRSIAFDRVDDVSEAVSLAAGHYRDEAAKMDIAVYEFSIPLATLNWQPRPGERVRADVGVLRGNGFQTMQRVYWHNKATGLTSDLPGEAELTPHLWGTAEVRAP
jgi:hypothetical protein